MTLRSGELVESESDLEPIKIIDTKRTFSFNQELSEEILEEVKQDIASDDMHSI